MFDYIYLCNTSLETPEKCRNVPKNVKCIYPSAQVTHPISSLSFLPPVKNKRLVYLLRTHHLPCSSILAAGCSLLFRGLSSGVGAPGRTQRRVSSYAVSHKIITIWGKPLFSHRCKFQKTFIILPSIPLPHFSLLTCSSAIRVKLNLGKTELSRIGNMYPYQPRAKTLRSFASQQMMALIWSTFISRETVCTVTEVSPELTSPHLASSYLPPRCSLKVDHTHLRINPGIHLELCKTFFTEHLFLTSPPFAPRSLVLAPHSGANSTPPRGASTQEHRTPQLGLLDSFFG